MRTRDAVIIGVSVVVGLAVHGYLARPAAADLPTAAERQLISQREVQAKMLDVYPRSVPVGNQTLLAMPRVGFRNNDLDINYDLFRLDGDRLVRVPLQ